MGEVACLQKYVQSPQPSGSALLGDFWRVHKLFPQGAQVPAQGAPVCAQGAPVVRRFGAPVRSGLGGGVHRSKNRVHRAAQVKLVRGCAGAPREGPTREHVPPPFSWVRNPFLMFSEAAQMPLARSVLVLRLANLCTVTCVAHYTASCIVTKAQVFNLR